MTVGYQKQDPNIFVTNKVHSIIDRNSTTGASSSYQYKTIEHKTSVCLVTFYVELTNHELKLTVDWSNQQQPLDLAQHK